MKNLIYIFGGYGQLGKEIHRKLKKKYSVTKFNKEKVNISNTKYYKYKIPKVIINCAAYTNVDGCETNKKAAYNINNLSLKNLCKYCKKNKILLIHFSTDFVFNGKIKGYYNEKSSCAPINFYGLSKLKGEKTIENNLENYFIFRVSWLYSKYKNNFVQTVKSKLKREKKLFVVNNLYGTPTSCEFIAKFLYFNLHKLIKYKKKQRLFHLTNGKKISKYDFSKRIEFYLKKKERIFASKYTYNYKFAKRPKNTALNSIFLKKIFRTKTENWEKDLKKVL
jgi:dTDP-4-dehydrorhamnose reductase